MGCVSAWIDWSATLYAAVLLSILATTGCSTVEPITADSALTSRTGIEWCSDIAPGSGFWLTEARRRFKDPFVVDCHGMDYGRGRGPAEWKLAPSGTGMPLAMDADSVAWAMHALMPDRDVVFIACNPHRLKLTAPRVWYYPSGNVWSHPAWATCKPVPHGTASSIWQFVEGKK